MSEQTKKEKQEDIDAFTEKLIKGIADWDMEKNKETYDELAQE